MGTGTLSRGVGIAPASTGNTYGAREWTRPNKTQAVSNGDYFQIAVDTREASDVVVLQINLLRNNQGPPNGSLDYSSDGGATFTQFEAINWSTASTPYVFDLSGISALEENENVVFRLYGWGNTNAAGFARISNIVVGTPPVVTELVALDERTLQITFSKPMSATALDPLNYAVAGTGALGTVAANPNSVVEGPDPGVYILGWPESEEFRGGFPVTVTATDITDTTVPTGILVGFPDFETTTAIGVAPTVLSIEPLNPSPANAAQADFLVLFDEAVMGLQSTDFEPVVTSGSLAGLSIESIAGGPEEWTITVNTGTGDGTFRLDQTGTASITDLAQNPIETTFTTGTEVEIDRTSPFVVSIDPVGGPATNATTAVFEVLFSEPIVGLDVTGPGFTNFLLAQTSGDLLDLEITSIAGGPELFEVSVAIGPGDGFLRLDLPAVGLVTDNAGNALAAPFAAGGLLEVDRTPPTVTLNQSFTQADPINLGPIHFTAIFSEPVLGLAAEDIDFAGSTVGGVFSALVTGGPIEYSIAVSGMTTNGLVVASIPAGITTDPAGNESLGSTSVDNVVEWDVVPPSVTVELAAGQEAAVNSAPVLFEVSFSEPVVGFGPSSVTLSGAASSGVSIDITGGPSTFVLSVDGLNTEGELTASIQADVVIDPAGNGNLASTSLVNTVLYDTTPPTVEITLAPGQSTPTNDDSSVRFLATFSEPVTGFDSASVDLLASTAGGLLVAEVTGGPMVFEIEITGVASDGDIVVTVPGAVAQDAAGNNSEPSINTANQVTIDTESPAVTVSLAPGQSAIDNGANVSFLVAFSKPVAGFDESVLDFSGATVTSVTMILVTGGPSVFIVTASDVVGEGTLLFSIPAGAVEDNLGNPSLASVGVDNQVIIDQTPPSVDSITLVDPNPSASTQVRFVVTFSEIVDGVSTANFSLIESGGLVDSTIDSVSGFISGGGFSFYEVVVSVGSGAGTLGLAVTDGVGVADLAGNPLVALPFQGTSDYTILEPTFVSDWLILND